MTAIFPVVSMTSLTMADGTDLIAPEPTRFRRSIPDPPRSSMHTKKLHLALIAALLAFVAVAGCSSSDTASTDTGPAGTEVRPQDVDTSGDTTETEVVDASADSGAADDTGVGEAPEGGVRLADGEAPAERTITFDGKAFSPGSLEIQSGENVTFKAVSATGGVKVGSLDSATISGGLIETFEFTEPGTYPVKEEVTGATATITVS
jgi:hypothetical protein